MLAFDLLIHTSSLKGKKSMISSGSFEKGIETEDRIGPKLSFTIDYQF